MPFCYLRTSSNQLPNAISLTFKKTYNCSPHHFYIALSQPFVYLAAALVPHGIMICLPNSMCSERSIAFQKQSMQSRHSNLLFHIHFPSFLVVLTLSPHELCGLGQPLCPSVQILKLMRHKSGHPVILYHTRE